MSQRILVAIPMYNCASQISRVLEKFDDVTNAFFKEILVIDNRSTDNSIVVCEDALKKLKNIKTTLVKNCENYNLGGSHKVAFNYALDNNYDYVVILHGDDQGNIKDLIPFLKTEQHMNQDCLLGSRFMSTSKLINYSWFRTFGNHCFNLLLSLICLRRIHDLGAGLNVYSTNWLKSRFYLQFPNALSFNYYMLLYTLSHKTTFKFFPISWKEEDQVSNVKLFRQTKELIRILLIYCFRRKQFLSYLPALSRSYHFEHIA